MPQKHPPASGADLDPAIRDFIRMTRAAGLVHRVAGETGFAAQRLVAEKVRAPWAEGGPVMVRTQEHIIPAPHGPLRLRLYDPGPAVSGKKPAVIYLHGGGWVMFSLDTHDRLMREYAQRSGACVVGVDYPLSPEARFPVALEQIAAAVRHLHGHGSSFGIDPARLAVAGDSAGGNMALAVAIMLRDAGEGDLVRALALSYGAFACDLLAENVTRFGGEAYMLTALEMAGFWDAYLARPEDRANPLAVPLHANLSDLPPVFLTIPSCDVLTGLSFELERRLAAAGNDCTSRVYAGAAHSFLEAVAISDLAARALDDAAIWLKTKLF